jgi:hypothetical protein
MKKAHVGFPVTPFPPSAHLENITIDRRTGKTAAALCSSEQTVSDRYLKAYLPTESSCEPMWPPSAPKTVE